MKVYTILAILLVSFNIACQKRSNEEHKVQNLETFAKLYGYARWFHPSDEAQKIDWDKFAVLGVQKVENIKSSAALRDTLYQLFSPIVQGLQIYETQKPEIFDVDILVSPDPNAKPTAWQHYGVYLNDQSNIYKSKRTNINESDTLMFDRVPQLGEIIKEPIGSNLVCVLPLTLLADETSTYPRTDSSKFVLLQSELNAVKIDKQTFNREVNLASVIITWNIIHHFSPYLDVIDTDWNEVLATTLKSTLTNTQKNDFFVTLSQMIAKLEDGHGTILADKMYLLPIRTEFIENEIVITASSDSTLKRGDIIRQINGKSAVETLAETEKMISGSPQLRRHRALNILGGKLYNYALPNNDNKRNKLKANGTQLLIDRDGEEENMIVANSRNGNMFYNRIDEQKYLSETIVEISPEIYYINMDKCTEKEFERNKDILANAKAVIYDLRGGVEFIFYQIASHLIKEPVTSTWWNIPQTIYPDHKELIFTERNWSVQPKQPFFKSKSIIINEPSVVSFGETMMGIIDHYNLATTVGTATAGCNGNVNYINLPCGYQVRWTGMKVLKHDGSQLYLKGFEPDYPVSKTIQAVKEGRDEYLEKALEIAKMEN